MTKHETAIDKIGNVVRNGQPHELMQQGRTLIQTRPNDYVCAMAVMQPRDEEAAIQRIEADCAADPRAMIYSWEVGEGERKSIVEGPTVKLAYEIAREYGNNAASAKLVEETATHYLFEGLYVDLQTGANIVRPYRMAKKNFSGKGKMQQDRAEDMIFEIGCSKSVRNAICNGVPARVMVRAMRAVKNALGTQALAGGAAAALPRVLAAFAPLKLAQEDLEHKIGKPAARWTKEDYGALRVALDSIMAGEATVEQLFQREQPEPPMDEPTTDAHEGQDVEQEPPPPEPPMDQDDDRVSEEERQAVVEETQKAMPKGTKPNAGTTGKKSRTLFGE